MGASQMIEDNLVQVRALKGLPKYYVCPMKDSTSEPLPYRDNVESEQVKASFSQPSPSPWKTQGGYLGLK